MSTKPEVWCGMATLHDRAPGRRAAVDSLLPQVDRITIVDGTGVGDQVKFASLREAPPDCIFLTVDDDLVYPPDYVERMIRGLDEHPGAIVSCHGWRLGQNGANIENHRCLEEVDGDHEVHVAGTGVMALRPRDLPAPLEFDAANVADMIVACYAEQFRIPRFVLGHEDGWLRYSEPPDTIWNQTVRQNGGPLDASAAKLGLIHELRSLIYYRDSVQYA